MLRRLFFQVRMLLLACLLTLFGLGVIALAAGEIEDHRIGLGIGFIILFLLSVLNGYYSDPADKS